MPCFLTNQHVKCKSKRGMITDNPHLLLSLLLVVPATRKSVSTTRSINGEKKRERRRKEKGQMKLLCLVPFVTHDWILSSRTACLLYYFRTKNLYVSKAYESVIRPIHVRSETKNRLRLIVMLTFASHTMEKELCSNFIAPVC